MSLFATIANETAADHPDSHPCGMAGAMAKPPLIDDDMVTRKFCCDRRDVVYVKSVAMGYDGLCCLFSEGGGQIVLAAPRGREAELDRLVDDVMAELGSVGSSDPDQKTECGDVAVLGKML